MNVYFVNPKHFSLVRFGAFLNILKVGEVYNLMDRSDAIGEYINLCGELCTFDRDNATFETALKIAVYKFIKPISTPIVEHGEWTGNFAVSDIYKDSTFLNPIKNIKNTEDKNLLVFYDEPLRGGSNDFAIYSLNILCKYSDGIDYSKRICFLKISSMLRDTMCLNSKRKWIVCKCTNKQTNRTYDPIMKYLYLETKKIYPKEREELSFVQFFLTKDGYDTRTAVIKKEQEAEEAERRWNEQQEVAYDDAQEEAREMEAERIFYLSGSQTTYYDIYGDEDEEW